MIAGNAKGDVCPIRIVLSSSFERKHMAIREAVLKRHGSYESVLELGGKVVGSKIVITDGLIPRAWIGYATFRVEDRDLSACWSGAGRALNPVGDMHYHPGGGWRSNEQSDRSPQASVVDEENSLRQASLYHVFNLQEQVWKRALKPAPQEHNGGYRTYVIDPFLSVHIPPNHAAPNRPPYLRVREKRSLWASLIAPSDGCSAFITASVIEHIYSSCDPQEPAIVVHEKAPLSILSDEEVAGLTGWPLERIRLEINRAQLEEEVAFKYRTDPYGYSSYRYGYDDYGTHWHDRSESGSSWKSSRKSRPKVRRITWESDCETLRYLLKGSSKADAAKLLREAASWVDGEQDKKGDFSFLAQDASQEEVLRALRECSHHITEEGQKGEQG